MRKIRTERKDELMACINAIKVFLFYNNMEELSAMAYELEKKLDENLIDENEGGKEND